MQLTDTYLISYMEIGMTTNTKKAERKSTRGGCQEEGKGKQSQEGGYMNMYSRNSSTYRDNNIRGYGKQRVRGEMIPQKGMQGQRMIMERTFLVQDRGQNMLQMQEEYTPQGQLHSSSKPSKQRHPRNEWQKN